jgi:hypothetical protein
MKIEEFLALADVTIDVAATDKRKLLGDLARKAAARLDIRADLVLSELLKREELGSTGVGGGIAHTARPLSSDRQTIRPAGAIAQADGVRGGRRQGRRYGIPAAVAGRGRPPGRAGCDLS